MHNTVIHPHKLTLLRDRVEIVPERRRADRIECEPLGHVVEPNEAVPVADAFDDRHEPTREGGELGYRDSLVDCAANETRVFAPLLAVGEEDVRAADQSPEQEVVWGIFFRELVYVGEHRCAHL